MFCAIEELATESDVEQKLIWPLLTTASPSGAGLLPADVLTKQSIRRLEIGKGTSRKLYFPDYMVVIAGLPVLVVEAKAPKESVEKGLDEARLYAAEINAQFPSGINPCVRVISCNGIKLLSSPADSASPDIELEHSEISIATEGYARLADLCSRTSLQRHADQIRQLFRKDDYRRPVSFVGGPSFQNEELAPNTFGATIVGDYGYVFNPSTREERRRIVKDAYVPSLRRQRYVEPIDRLIRGTVLPTTARLPVIEDSALPSEIYTALQDRRKLESEVLLLVGSVGSGKSTFVDYVSMVALPAELREKTIWARINLNDAPLSTDVAYSWIAKALSEELAASMPGTDVDELETLSKIFYPELSRLRRGALQLLDPESIEYKTRLADELLNLQRDQVGFAKCLARFACSGPGKLLVIVLDNCDKRTRDEQLTMFQIAHWVRTEFKCLVILPLRDVTFDLHRMQPPLDTAIKGLIFRIEPPPFIEVLQARVYLALKEMEAASATAPKLTYDLPNGMRVSYPASDQSVYLASILRSLYAHDRFVRRIMTGLAGRDVRRALELFLDFCMSGHIGEDEIYKIRFFEGRYVLPLSVLARVLLRGQRRYYDGDKAYVKNLVQCSPGDALPDHFVRLAILHWLERKQNVRGPAGVMGFHRVEELVRDLVQLGHDAQRIRLDLIYLAREGCAVPEHQRLDQIADGDLVKITASGLVHLQLMANPEYLAACAEDTYISDLNLAQRIAERIASRGIAGQFSPLTTAKNASELVEYLKERSEEKIGIPEIYLEKADATELKLLREAEAGVGATEIEVSRRLYVGNLPPATTTIDLQTAFDQAELGFKEAVVPPRASGNPSRWYSIVEVRDGKSALKAVDARDLTIGGRRLVIDEARPLSTQVNRSGGKWNPTLDVTERLFIAGLPDSATEEMVRRIFQNHGLNPVDVYLPRDKRTTRPKGFGFIAMGSHSEAAQAIGAVNGSLVDGRAVTVRPAMPQNGRSAGR